MAVADHGRIIMAKIIDVGSIVSHFESLSDPRHTRNRKHLLIDIIVIAVAGIISGCDGPTAIHRWAKERHTWLTLYLALPNGIPSRDCLRRLLMMLKPEAFQHCFQNWLASLATSPPSDPSHSRAGLPSEPNAQRIVAID